MPLPVDFSAKFLLGLEEAVLNFHSAHVKCTNEKNETQNSKSAFSDWNAGLWITLLMICGL